MSDIQKVLDTLEIEAIYGIDFETYWADDFTLKSIPTTEYICDERFKAHCVSVQRHDERKPVVLSHEELMDWRHTVDWKRVGILAHHAHFDCLIASHHYGIKPKAYLDTLSMARPLMPIEVGGSLKALCAAFGRQSKLKGAALVNTKNKRDLTKAEYRALASYCGDDIVDTWFLFHKLLSFLPLEELTLISLTVKMFADPSLMLDGKLAAKLAIDEAAHKQQMLDATKLTSKQLGSANQFADILRDLGIEPPVKISKTTQKETFAFSQTDQAFKQLLDHPDERVREVVEARFAIKSTQLETRADKIVLRAPIGKQPVYLNYARAHTMRWSGGDKINWQNFGRSSGLRRTIQAPLGHSIIIADQSQIEARITALRAGQMNIVEAFAAGEDVYAMQASAIYHRPINKKDDPHERFVGKVCTLMLGFGGGAARFRHTLAIGQFGPPVFIEEDEAKSIVSTWRIANSAIKASWRSLENDARQAWTSPDGAVIENNGVELFKQGPHGFIRLPNDLLMRYDNLYFDDRGGMLYQARKPRGRDVDWRDMVCLHGGFLVENVVQAVARVVIGQQMIRIAKEVPYLKIATCSHDELVLVVRNKLVPRAMKEVTQIMQESPAWMPKLPLAVDIHATRIYDKE